MSEMKCPACGTVHNTVRDSRPVGDLVRRRRVCTACKERFTTYEVPASVIEDTRKSAAETFEVQQLLTKLFKDSDILKGIKMPTPPPHVPRLSRARIIKQG